MVRLLSHIKLHRAQFILWTICIAALIVMASTSVRVAYGTVCDMPGNPCGISSIENPKGCVGSPDPDGTYHCGGGSGGGGGPAEGSSCTSAANACGAKSTGVIHGGVCSKKTQTGTTSKGDPTYTYTALNPPALPAGYGTACNSPANSCGTKTAGTITCSGTCSKTTAPANPVGYGTACTSTNACGVSANGTKTCSLTCSAATPALPAGYGTACQSAANACGAKGSGTIACSGSCSASIPALPAGYGTSCQSAANACGMKASGVVQCSGSCSASVPSNNLCAPDATTSLRANPSLVQRGSTATVTWSSSNAASCTVTGTNSDSWSGTSGSRSTTGITDRTTYTLACVSVNGKAVSPLTTTVDIVPAFHEF